jgi:hypothetical protein
MYLYYLMMDVSRMSIPNLEETYPKFLGVVFIKGRSPPNPSF